MWASRARYVKVCRMAAGSPGSWCPSRRSRVARVDQREDPLGGHRQLGRADADRVLDGAGDGGGYVPDRRLADPARPERALALAALDDADEHVGEVLRVRDQVV